MILHESSIIKLDYSPATDILQVDYPDLHSYKLSEVKRGLTLMVEAIRNYDVKKLLLDASKTVIEISEEENRELGLQLASDFVKTRLQKVARIQPLDFEREIKAQENIRNFKHAGLLPYQLRTFTSRDEAIEWLNDNAIAA